MRFKVGDIVTPKEGGTIHRIIKIDKNRSTYQMERLDGRYRVDIYEISTVDKGARKLTKLEQALK
jgi:uncharacterized protein YodC (DUF2158 family)